MSEEMGSRSFLHLGRWLAMLLFLTSLCAASVASPSLSGDPVTAPPSVDPIDDPTTVATTALATSPTASNGATLPTSTAATNSTTTRTLAPIVVPDVLANISMRSVPRDVIVPTNASSLDEVTNPINGRRGGSRPLPDDIDCATGSRPCLIGMLDTLGFDVTSGSRDDRDRRLQRATGVVQLDAGLPMTGFADDELLEYLGIATDTTSEARADEFRQIGTSANGRPIMAQRYGDGPKKVLVVGQTHGDEEGGLRILLRVRSLPLPEEITLWVIPTMNPDGLVADTRFLANGDDPNRAAVSQPEQQAVYDFALSTRPSLTVWYHQNYGWVGASGASTTPATHYQSLTGLGTLKHSGNCVVKGFMWCPIDDAIGSSSILVELPDVLTPNDVQVHADALLAVASNEAP